MSFDKWKPSRDECIALVEAYGKAWAAQDPAAICALFTDDATYNERPFVSDQAVFCGRKEIEKYWIRQIVGKQANIRFKQHIEDLMVDEEKSCCLVKWEARFDSMARGIPRPVHFIQVAILQLLPPVPGAPSCLPQIKALEEYWHSKGQDAWTKGGELDRGEPKEWGEPKRDARICWNFSKGLCKRGNDCPYTHDAYVEPTTTPEPPAKKQKGAPPPSKLTGLLQPRGAQQAPPTSKAAPLQTKAASAASLAAGMHLPKGPLVGPTMPLPSGPLVGPTMPGQASHRPPLMTPPSGPPLGATMPGTVKGQGKGNFNEAVGAVAKQTPAEPKPAQPKRGKGIRNDR